MTKPETIRSVWAHDQDEPAGDMIVAHAVGSVSSRCCRRRTFCKLGKGKVGSELPPKVGEFGVCHDRETERNRTNRTSKRGKKTERRPEFQARQLSFSEPMIQARSPCPSSANPHRTAQPDAGSAPSRCRTSWHRPRSTCRTPSRLARGSRDAQGISLSWRVSAYQPTCVPTVIQLSARSRRREPAVQSASCGAAQCARVGSLLTRRYTRNGLEGAVQIRCSVA